MNQKILFLVAVCFNIQILMAQNDQFAGPPEQSVHTSVKYNRFLFNPAFSFDKEAAESNDKNGYISVFGRFEKTGFDDGPTDYRVTYNKSILEKMAIGAAIFQKTEGVISNLGALINYAYNVAFNRDVDMTFGLNLKYQKAGLISGIRSQNPLSSDAFLSDFDNTSLIRLSPAVNIRYNNFDFGLVARNIVNSQLGTESEIFNSSTIALHGMYTRPFSRRSPNTFRGLLYAEQQTEADLRLGFNGMVENNKYGFAQLGFNTKYGISLGLGFNIAPFATVGYTIERGIGNADIFGLVHEVTLAYNFIEPQRKSKRKKSKPSRKLPKLEELSKKEKEVALEEARENQKEYTEGLTALKAKADLLRTTVKQNEEEKARAGDLVKTINSQIDEDDLENAKATLTQVKNNKYISEKDKKSIISRLTRKIQLVKDVEEENTRIASLEEQKSEAKALLSRTLVFIENDDIERATAALQRIQTNKYISKEEKRNISTRLERIVKRKESEQIAFAEEEKQKEAASELVRVTNTLLDSDKIEEAQAKATLIRQNKFIPKEEKEKILSRIKRVVSAQNKVEESEQIAFAEEEKQKEAASELVRVTNTLLDSDKIEEAQAKTTLIRQNKFISKKEKKKILSRIKRVVSAQNKVEEEKRKQSALEKIVKKDTSELDRLASEEAARVAEEVRLAEQARLASEEAARVAEEARLAEQARLASEEAARVAEEARLAEQARLASEEAARVAEEARLAEQARLASEEAARVAEEARLAEQARLASEEAARAAEEAKLAEEKKSELLRATKTIVESRDIKAAKARIKLIRKSTLIPNEEKEEIISNLQKIIEEDVVEKANEEAALKKRATLKQVTKTIEIEEKRKTAKLKRVTKVSENQEKSEEQKKPVQSILKRTTTKVKK